MSSKFDFDHLCQLASLGVSKKEREELEPQLLRIVRWVDKLQELNLQIPEGKSCPEISSPSRHRKDEILPSQAPGEALANAPEKEKGFFKVPQVIKSK